MARDIRIVVLQRGWVVVGEYSREGMECRVARASVIRRWGTTKGLGELRRGPLPGTELDPAGEMEHHRLTEVMTIRCDAAGWESRLV